MKCFSVGVIAIIWPCIAFGVDVVRLSNGNSIEGVVLQESKDTVTIAQEHSTITLNKSEITGIDRRVTPKSRDEAIVKSKSERSSSVNQRIPDWTSILSSIAKQTWATELTQVPATVISKGVLRSVPYMSYHCGKNYELNVYGDPEQPAGVEIGIRGSLLSDPTAKKNCLNFIASVLNDKVDAAIITILDQKQDIVIRKGLTIEITPPNAEDAEGGWWLSIYDQILIESSRATAKEIEQISVARNTRPHAVAGHDQNGQDHHPWTKDELERSRPNSGASSGPDRVYVRGYYRKDGSYVSPHTRSAPRRR